MIFRLLKSISAIIFAGLLASCGGLVEGDGRSLQPLSSQVVSGLSSMGSSPGEAMMIRIFKQESELEVWKRVGDGTFKLFKTYEICTFSGDLGPKIREGDRQSPEGFYTITRGLMNPRSNYYLSFNLGFPNKFDRAYGRTGSNLMVHGDCSSRGCYAMTDEKIAEIFSLARESFSGGNSSFQVQVFPFRMTTDNLALHSDSPNLAYWQNLKTGSDHFDITRTPPTWDVCGRQYVFNASSQSGAPLDARASCPALQTNAALMAQVDARHQADQAAYEVAVANIADVQARRVAAAAQQAETDAALAEQTLAINEGVSGVTDTIGNFFSGLFGGGETEQPVQLTNDASAPVPTTAPPRT